MGSLDDVGIDSRPVVPLAKARVGDTVRAKFRKTATSATSGVGHLGVVTTVRHPRSHSAKTYVEARLFCRPTESARIAATDVDDGSLCAKCAEVLSPRQRAPKVRIIEEGTATADDRSIVRLLEWVHGVAKDGFVAVEDVAVLEDATNSVVSVEDGGTARRLVDCLVVAQDQAAIEYMVRCDAVILGNVTVRSVWESRLIVGPDVTIMETDEASLIYVYASDDDTVDALEFAERGPQSDPASVLLEAWESGAGPLRRQIADLVYVAEVLV